MFGQMLRNLPPVTKNLLILNILIWLVTELAGPSFAHKLSIYAGLHYFSSGLFNPFQLVTYMFLHANFTHLFFNMFALFMFGGLLERTLDSRRFLFYYISCGIGAGLIQEGVYAIMVSRYSAIVDPQVMTMIQEQGAELFRQSKNYVDPFLGSLNSLINSPTVGASGAIYGILLAFGMLYPNMRLYLMFIPYPIKAKWMVAGYAVLELLLGLSNRAGDNVAHFAHLGGMLIGLLMILYWKRTGLFRNRYF